MTSPWLGRVVPWAVGAALLGVVTGFAFGKAGDGDPDGSGSSTESAITTVAPSSTSVPDPTATLECVGTVAAGPPFVAVAGVADLGATALATNLGVAEVSLTFEELQDAKAHASFQASVLAEAGRGPILLVVRLSSGPFQKRLASEVARASGDSVVVVVNPDAPPSGASLGEFPGRSIAVASSVGVDEPFSDSWAQVVGTTAQGGSPCTPPGG